MKIILVHPSLTLGDDDARARQFFEACRDELQRWAEVVVALNLLVLAQASLGREDAVVFFNQAPGKPYPPQLLSVLEKAVAAGAEVVPIAMREALRVPPPGVTHAQSWDIVEQLRQRGVRGAPDAEHSVDIDEQLRLRAQPPENLTPVALQLSRTIISRLKPTLAKDRMYFFISHRRLDGDQLAGALYDKLHQRNESAFRDLNDIAVGEKAQREIAANLSRADAVIFLDTPLAAASEWVLQELRGALSRSIPIVWIRLGPEAGKDASGEKQREDLPVKPGAAPHLSFPEASAFEATPDLVDKILDVAFRLSWESAFRVYGEIAALQKLQEAHAFELKPLDQRALIYAAHFPRALQRYPERQVSHLLQFYGRLPTGNDVAHLREDMRRLGFAPPHEVHGPFCDAVLLLSPFPSLPSAVTKAGECVVDSTYAYVKSMAAHLQGDREGNKKGLIISGAFPDPISPESAQILTTAVQAFVRATLEEGATVIFGAHPTFQPLIFELARQLWPTDFKQLLRLYVSRLFVPSEAELEALREHATVFPVEAVGTDRNRSLTRMREAMIADERAVGLVALGGRPPRPDITAGVDEESDLASGRQLPRGASEPARKLAVFFAGAPGGRAAELAVKEEKTGWMSAWNSLTTEQNELLRTSPDFNILADLVLRSVGIKA